MSVGQIYKAINAVSGELAPVGIPKLHRNERDDYLYRSIDDVLNRLSPLLVKHKLVVVPRVLERVCVERAGDGDLILLNVCLKVAFDLVSAADGSSHRIEVFGEALDPGDKATAKAMSSAYKHAMLQLFCVPVAQIDDADRSSYRLRRPQHQCEPVEGWERWTAGIIDIVTSCASSEAIERLQQRQRSLLVALGRERPDLYALVGKAVTARSATLTDHPGREPVKDEAGNSNPPPRQARSRKNKASRPASSSGNRRHAKTPAPEPA